MTLEFKLDNWMKFNLLWITWWSAAMMVKMMSFVDMIILISGFIVISYVLIGDRFGKS